MVLTSPEVSSSDKLLALVEKIGLDAIVYHNNDNGFIDVAGDSEIIDAIKSSNCLQVIKMEMALPITIGDEVFEVLFLNNRGFVAKAGKSDKYLIATKISPTDIIFSFGEKLDPGLIMFEILSLVS